MAPSITSFRFGELFPGKVRVSVCCSGGFNGLTALAICCLQAAPANSANASSTEVERYRFISGRLDAQLVRHVPRDSRLFRRRILSGMFEGRTSAASKVKDGFLHMAALCSSHDLTS